MRYIYMLFLVVVLLAIVSPVAAAGLYDDPYPDPTTYTINVQFFDDVIVQVGTALIGTVLLAKIVGYLISLIPVW